MKALPLVEALLRGLEERGALLCHWKSNEHLEQALAGETDLDLLIRPADRGSFDRVSAELGFLQAERRPELRMPGRSDPLGFDASSGRLVHVDLHEQLVLGEQVIKNHRLPIEAELLEDTVQSGPVRIPAPELELVLLWIRAHLKLTPERLRERRERSGIKTLPSAIVREFEHLDERSDPERLRARLAELDLGLDAEALLEGLARVLDGSVTTPQLAQTRAELLRALRRFRRRGPLATGLQRLRLWASRSQLARRLHRQGGRRLPRGLVVALVGADGAGKSSHCDALAGWLGAKLWVEPLYLGIPKSHRLDRTLVAWRKALRRRQRTGGLPSSLAASAEPWVEAARWWLVARHRLRSARRAGRQAERGAVVLSDRYPLPEFEAMPTPMDGPRIRKAGGPGLLAALEERAYRRLPPPDALMVLRAPLPVLRERKDDLDLETHREKAEAVLALSAGPNRQLVDAALPEAQVLAKLKARLWETLRGRLGSPA